MPVSTDRPNSRDIPLPRRALNAALAFAITICAAVLGILGSAGPASAVANDVGGRFTWMKANGTATGPLDGITFPGAGYGEVPFTFAAGNNVVNLGVYYNGRFTVRRDDGTYWGVTMPGAGQGEYPIAVDFDGDGRSDQLGVYYQGRFTFIRLTDQSIWGVTIPGGGLAEIPVTRYRSAARGPGNGQDVGVYFNGRFTFIDGKSPSANPSLYGFTFPGGASYNELPFVIDTDGNGTQELAVYNNGRMTWMNDNGSLAGVTFPGGADIDEVPLVFDANHDGRQEFMVYSHVASMIYAKQLVANPAVDKPGYALDDIRATAQGGTGSAGARMSNAILYALVRLAHGHSYKITALQDRGTGHSSGSAHYSGDAVDFGSLDGGYVNGSNTPSWTIVDATKNFLPSGSRFGQINCTVTSGARPTLPAGIGYQTDPFCNHLHLETPRSAPR